MHQSTSVAVICRHLTRRTMAYNCLFKLGQCFFVSKANKEFWPENLICIVSGSLLILA